jgi:ADP-ribosylglycohydrolase
MLGAIIGDIVGSRFEFNPVKTCDFELFEPTSHFTDDSVLTLATAAALFEQQPFATCYRAYYRRYPNAGYGKRFTAWAQSDSDQPYNSYANGAAMRVAPVAWVADSLATALALAARSAAVTHNHPAGIKGAQAVAGAIYLARTGMAKEEIRRWIEERFDYSLHLSLAQIRPDYGFDVSCQGSVPEALCCFFESTDFLSAIRLAVSLGGDADTQAAIAGSIAEAFYGAIPFSLATSALDRLDPFLRQTYQRFAQRWLNDPCS